MGPLGEASRGAEIPASVKQAKGTNAHRLQSVLPQLQSAHHRTFAALFDMPHSSLPMHSLPYARARCFFSHSLTIQKRWLTCMMVQGFRIFV